MTWQPTTPCRGSFSDFGRFLSRVNADCESTHFFDRGAPMVVTRAPARLDVMGGIADYSGSSVLQLPLAEATYVALQRTTDAVVRLRSLATVDRDRALEVDIDVSDFTVDYGHARNALARDSRRHWASYAAGAFAVLAHELGTRFDSGARIWISSDVPEGAGVSSSAALEVAVMRAICVAFDINMGPRDLALLCQKVENEIVGAACGVMDQMVSAMGAENQLLVLHCQPAELGTAISIPKEIAFFGIDSGLRHQVSGTDYTRVRVGAFMGRRIMSTLGRETNYLANVGPDEFERDYAQRLPLTIRGRDFLDRYGSTGDGVTHVDPEQTYAVRTPTAHPIHEHARACRFALLFRRPLDDLVLIELGHTMAASHQSMTDCGLGSQGTDLIVELAREAGPQSGIFGAKITGGGCGGTVAIMASREAEGRVAQIAGAYRKHAERGGYVFAGSSAGAATFHCAWLAWTP